MSGNSGIESLYPFLYADTADLAAVLEQVRASTVAKAEDILQLRRTICARDAARLERCACEAAARFAGGRRGAQGRAEAVGVQGVRHRAPRRPPIGTCMVSPEGACAAYYNFGRMNRNRVAEAAEAGRP